MKKLLALFAVAFATLTASAQPFVGLGFDYDRLTGDAGHQSTTTATVGYQTTYGAADLKLYGERNTNVRINANAFEIGYTTPTYAITPKIGVLGRVAGGRKNFIDQGGSGFVDYYSYYSLETEVNYPVSQELSSFVGYRFQNSTQGSRPENRGIVGVDYKFNNSVSGRLGLTHTKFQDQRANGIVSGLIYKF